MQRTLYIISCLHRDLEAILYDPCYLPDTIRSVLSTARVIYLTVTGVRTNELVCFIFGDLVYGTVNVFCGKVITGKDGLIILDVALFVPYYPSMEHVKYIIDHCANYPCTYFTLLEWIEISGSHYDYNSTVKSPKISHWQCLTNHESLTLTIYSLTLLLLVIKSGWEDMNEPNHLLLFSRKNIFIRNIYCP